MLVNEFVRANLLDVALECAARGWYVFPCRPRGKEPLVKGGFHAAVTDETAIREWWAKTPDANVGIATGKSGLTVLDIDTGINGVVDLADFEHLRKLPRTYAVRTGRRPDFGVQLYFEGGAEKSIPWQDSGVSGDIRSATGYVLAEGSVHPSGERYEKLIDGPIAPVPAFVKALRSAATESLGADAPIVEHRNTTLVSIAGKLRNAGLSADALEVALLQVNADRCVPPMGDEEVKRIAANASKWALPGPDPVITLGGKVVGGDGPIDVEPVDVWSRFHSFEEMDQTPPMSWLIDGFLPYESITGLAAAVAQRKSIIALNITHALVTGEPLFGHFKVMQKPERVLYLCPEMGIRSFTRRLREIGLVDYIGKNLFCQTMSTAAEALFTMDSLTPEVLRGSFVILDTAIRYIEGNESDSEHMRVFGKKCMRLNTLGAVGSLILYHSSKGGKETATLTLENSLRGSGELGAFITNCWATRLQDPKNEFESNSYLDNVKPRDYEEKPPSFEAAPVKGSYRMTYVEGSEGCALQSATAFKTDGKSDAAVDIIKDNPTATLTQLEEMTKEAGCPRKKSWLSRERAALRGTGNKSSEG